MTRYQIRVEKYPSPPVWELVQDKTGITKEKLWELFKIGSIWLNLKYTKERIRDPFMSLKMGDLDVFVPEFPIVEYTLDPNLIIYEDEDLMAVYKLPNLNTVQSPFSDLDCLVRGVQKLLDSRGQSYQVNAVHRLDLPAQGVVLFGKHKTAEKALHRMFMDRRVKKIYLAETEKFDLEKDLWYLRDLISWREKSQEAWSFIKYLGDREQKMVFAASPLTGRTHQLRIHFSKYLKPIWGDVLYGGYIIPEELRLASVYYRFRHPLKQKLMEICHVPDSFKPVPSGVS